MLNTEKIRAITMPTKRQTTVVLLFCMLFLKYQSALAQTPLIKPTDAIVREANADILVNSAYEKKKKNDYKGALADLNKSLEVSRSFKGFLLRGSIELRLNQLKAAMSDFDEAIKMEPNESMGYLSRGLLKGHLKDLKGAVSDFDIALEIDPSDDDVWAWRGDAKQMLKNLQGAVADYRHALSNNQSNLDAHEGLERALRLRGEKEEAGRELKTIKKLKQESKDK